MTIDALLLEIEGVLVDTRVQRAQALDEATRAAAAVGLDATDAELIAVRAARTFEDLMAGPISLVPGARAAIAALAARVPLLVVTRAPARVAERVLALAELDAVVRAVIAVDDASRYRRALERLARLRPVDPARVVAIESSDAGVAAAQAAGLRTVAVGHEVASVAGVTYDALVDLLANRGARSS